MSDPVTAGDLFEPQEQPSEADLRAAAVDAVARVMARKWVDQPVGQLLANASDLLDLALEVGPSGAAVLVPGNHTNRVQLADAVRRTGTSHCVGCPDPPAPYDGHPTDQDLRAAEQVIVSLLGKDGPPSR